MHDDHSISSAMNSSTQHRVVHIDLKGAPPKVQYYAKLFPLLKRWGATSLLMEYEDTFPYTGELKDIASIESYSLTEVQEIQSLATANKLEIIPLVQTFGHFEFVLKHEKFRHLREVPSFPMTLCPLNEGSMSLLKQLIDQMIQAHPNTRWFHIGADEVFHLGVCKSCHRYMHSKNLAREQMFFLHVQRVLGYIRSTYPDMHCIMWDDMFRELSLTTIQNAAIGDKVEPMVWYYQRDFKSLPSDIWERYSQVFPSIWVASAFKGATGPCMFVTDISYHIKNHVGWLDQVKKIKERFKTFRGFALTGWQRYDHYAVLCELLPVALPALAICLLTVKEGEFSESVHKAASADLEFSSLIPLNPFESPNHIPLCDFPGSKVYTTALQCLSLKYDYKKFLKNDRMNGWMTMYHVRHNYTNPAHLKHFLPEGQKLLQGLQQLEANANTHLSEYFQEETVDEWLSVLVTEKRQKISDIVNNALEQINLGARVKGTKIDVEN